jgi:intein/homing endonuclease
MLEYYVVNKHIPEAAVMKLVDIGVSKSPAGNSVRVQVPPAAQINSEVLSYVIGAALGDGNLSCPNGRATRLRITCDAKYPLVAREIEESLQLIFPSNRVSRVYRAETYFDISVYSNTLNDLLPWSVGKGTKIAQSAHVPEWIKQDISYVKSCIKGLIHTDGSIYIDRGYKMVHFSNRIQELAYDCYEMIKSLGYQPRIYEIPLVMRAKYVVRLSKDVELFLADLQITKE